MSTVEYLKLRTGDDGHSYFSEEEFDLQAIGGGLADPVRGTGPHPASHYAVRVVPPGWERDWGPAAHPILAIYLTGEAEIEANNGDTRKLVPGVLLLAEDTSGGYEPQVENPSPSSRFTSPTEQPPAHMCRIEGAL